MVNSAILINKSSPFLNFLKKVSEQNNITNTNQKPNFAKTTFDRKKKSFLKVLTLTPNKHQVSCTCDRLILAELNRDT